MATVTSKNSNKNETIFIAIKEDFKTATKENVDAIANIINKEIGEHKLNKEEKKQLQEIMNVEALEALKWQNIADVLNYLNIFSIAENNPKSIKKIIQILLDIVGIFYPVAKAAGYILASVPEKLFSALIKIGGFASPEYMLYRGAKMIADRKSEKARAKAEIDMNDCENMVNLIIVCKSSFLSEEMSKLIDTDNVIEGNTVVGTKDRTIHTTIWNQAAWEAYHNNLTNNDKVLIIGKIKNITPLKSEQIRFNKFGVKYGWNNNIVMVEADPKCLKNAEDYNDFLSAINDLQISEKFKENVKLKFDWGVVTKLALFPPLLIGDSVHENLAVREQQLLFGLSQLYIQDLSEFLTSEVII